MTNDWMHKAITETYKLLPRKYIDGTYITDRYCTDEFTDDDINLHFYYVCDILPGQLSCTWKDNGKKYIMTAGECTTITMMERCIEYMRERSVVYVLLMAYFHDMDSILSSCLTGKTIGKVHRRTTLLIKSWKRNTIDLIGFWNSRCKKYLPLVEKDYEIIQKQMESLGQEVLIRMFDSDDVSLFAEHFCEIIKIAFDTKVFALKTFSMDACEAALEYIDD